MLRERISEYDVVRAFLTLLVIIGHAGFLSYNTLTLGGVDFGNVNSSWANTLVAYITSAIYTFHMPMFMALSGAVYCMTNSNRLSLGKMVSNKYKRLILPCLLVTTFYIVPIKYISGYFDNVNLLDSVICGQYLIMEYASHTWFLWALFFIFLYAKVIEKFVNVHWVCLLMLLLILNQIVDISKNSDYSILAISRSLYYLFWFYVGYYFHMNKKRIDAILLNHSVALFSLVLFIFFIKYSFGPISIIRPLPGIVLSYYLCSIISKGIKSDNYIYRIISAKSYDLYLYHEPLNYFILFIVVDCLNIELGNSGIIYFIHFILRCILVYYLSLIISSIIVFLKSTLKNRVLLK